MLMSMFSNPPLLYDFQSDSDLKNWNVVDDRVMGGQSLGNLEINAEGFGRYWGQVSLENNGGFSSLRHNFTARSVEDYSKIVLRLKGDGKDYQIRIKHKRRDYYSYIYTVSTSGEWETLEVDLKDMRPSFRGRFLDLDNFDKESIEELAFLIGNKKNEGFELLIDKIELD
jgi:NADH dehydrogenase [ubiquinone] 1 alpha subcomplex assembly factor 1